MRRHPRRDDVCDALAQNKPPDLVPQAWGASGGHLQRRCDGITIQAAGITRSQIGICNSRNVHTELVAPSTQAQTPQEDQTQNPEQAVKSRTHFRGGSSKSKTRAWGSIVAVAVAGQVGQVVPAAAKKSKNRAWAWIVAVAVTGQVIPVAVTGQVAPVAVTGQVVPVAVTGQVVPVAVADKR